MEQAINTAVATITGTTPCAYAIGTWPVPVAVAKQALVGLPARVRRMVDATDFDNNTGVSAAERRY